MGKLVPKPLVLTLVHEMDVNGKNYVSKITEGDTITLTHQKINYNKII